MARVRFCYPDTVDFVCRTLLLVYIEHVMKKYSYEYPRASLTVDCVVFGFDPTAASLKVLLVRRLDDPFKGSWALPGGFVNVSDEDPQGESLEEAAMRELNEETGLKIEYLEQLYTFGTPGRDPRGRVVSVAHFALVKTKDHKVVAGSDASEATWFEVANVRPASLAFDHAEILKVGLARLEAKVRWAPIGFNLLPAEFTLTELQGLYEVVLRRPLDKRNFRKRILAMKILTEVGTTGEGRMGRPARLYRFDKRAYNAAVKTGFNFEI